jgi:WD40 repeat protein
LSYQKSSKDKQKKNKQLDKPITFHTRIKSSGYGAASNNCIKKKSIQERKTLPSKQQQTSSKDSSFMASYLKEYPVDCGVLQHFQEKHALPRQNFLHQGAIHHIEYSRDAKFLASAGQDKVAQVAKLPFSKFQGESNIFAGHDGPIRSIHWSHNNQMLLSTSSVDQTTRVWLADADTPSIIFGAAGNDPTAKGGNAHLSSAKRAMKRDIVDAQFFYMDKFILSAAGNSLRMHQFELDEVYARNLKKKITKNDVQVDENKSRKKKIAQWNCNDIQNITSLTCINSFLSHLVVLSGSDRSLRIFDVAQGKIVRTISDAHPKAPHTIALPNVSCYVSHPSNFYDLLLSSAVANGSMGGSIHLWDVRADNCMMRFGEHVNRVHPLGMSFSPCMRYIATGSEDRAAYIYDIRTGRSVTKLTGHTDVVTSVAFNPLYPQLATASYDGTIRFYSHKPN